LVNQVTAPAQRGILPNVRRTAAVPVAWLFHGCFTHFLFHTVGQEDEGAPSGEDKKERERESPSLFFPARLKKKGWALYAI